MLVDGQRFREDRVFGTASWLGESWRGQGLGLEVRAAALQFGVGVLAGRRALSKAFSDNVTSLGVTKRLGYSLSGASLFVGGESTGRRVLHYRLDRRRWESYVRRDDVRVDGMCVHFL